MIELKVEQLGPTFPSLPCDHLSELAPLSFADTQPRTASAIARLAQLDRRCNVMLLGGYPGADYEQLLMHLIDDSAVDNRHCFDLCYAENLRNPAKPIWLKLKAGSGIEFCELVADLLRRLQLHLDAEEVVQRILRKQDQDEKIADYLSLLAAHVAMDGTFSHPILINLLIHHASENVPLIYGRDLSWESLFGAVSFQTEQGTVFSHHHLLEPGLLREANGGFLILPLEELLADPDLWFKLRNALETGFLDWTPSKEAQGLVPLFQPEASPLQLRLILVGNTLQIAEFAALDPDMTERVFLRTDLVSEISLQDEFPLFLGMLRGLCDRLGIADLDQEAMLGVARFACRLCEHQQLLSIEEAPLAGLLQLAACLAKEEQVQCLTGEHIQMALSEQEYRLNYVVEQSDQGIVDGQIMLQTRGEIIGQINGLSVIQIMGHPYDFGEPVRLTATVHMGDGDVADIERKAELAGHIHAKAMMIIHGYLSTQFGAENPSPLSANLVFEQSYHEIDGDSAALTGLCALLSALALQPIRQCYAVTGAVDQFGNVQPVGGLNEKIEGFFRVCSIQGLTGEQGVLIPASNELQLILSNDVQQAVAEGRFHIYPVKHVTEAVELLTGCVAGDLDDEQSLFGRIQLRLDELSIPPGGQLGLMGSLLRRLLK